VIEDADSIAILSVPLLTEEGAAEGGGVVCGQQSNHPALRATPPYPRRGNHVSSAAPLSVVAACAAALDLAHRFARELGAVGRASPPITTGQARAR